MGRTGKVHCCKSRDIPFLMHWHCGCVLPCQLALRSFKHASPTGQAGCLAGCWGDSCAPPAAHAAEVAVGQGVWGMLHAGIHSV